MFAMYCVFYASNHSPVTKKHVILSFLFISCSIEGLNFFLESKTPEFVN